ncbi:MAG: efflux RND transporter periplasmic adaptor subunit [Anaerolineae bacterium]|nr:efflux RND transporter periplasmic adaptor subunit [Anaerolineae bacterium]
MSKRSRIIIGSILGGILIIAIALGAVYFGVDSQAREQLFSQLDIETGKQETGLLASGFIEAEEVELAAEIGGRVTELPFEEGDEVRRGDVLVKLNTDILQAQLDAAQANLALAEAERDLVEYGVPEEIIAQAEAQIGVAQASITAAQTVLYDAVNLRDNPQDIQVMLVEAETQVETAAYQTDVAKADMNFSEWWIDRGEEWYRNSDLQVIWHNDPDYEYPGWNFSMQIAPRNYEDAQENLAQAQVILAEANSYLGTVQSMLNNPQELQAQVVNAQASLDTAQVQLDNAQANLDELRAGPTDEELNMAEARVEEAEAAVNSIKTRIDRMILYAPIDGVILEQSIHVGELAGESVPLITLANLDNVELTVYIGEEQFNYVSLNQSVTVTVDSFPNREFEGTVTYISNEAEFTPRSVQTREERVNLVYAIKISLDNPDHALKPGMPADAQFDS